MWTADPGELQELLRMFKSTLLLNKAERSAANDALSRARQQPAFENYLVDILIKDTAATSDVRAAAGLNLKNCITKNSKAPRQYVLDCVFAGLAVPDTMVRNITGTVITALFAAKGVNGWPEALPQLLGAVENNSLPAESREAALAALEKICEDNLALLDRDTGGESPVEHVARRMVAAALLNASTPRIRAAAVFCVNQLLYLKSPHINGVLDIYVPALFAWSSDADAKVRKNVCLAFSLLLELYLERLLPHLLDVVNYCVHLVQDADEAVAMEACEFLLAVAELPQQQLRPHFVACLPKALPVLLQTMVYTPDDVVLYEMQDSEEDAAVIDRPEDIRPSGAKSRANHGREGDDSDSDSDDDDDDDEWNLRRCAALTLDALALVYPQEVLDVALPILQVNIVSDEWPVREAAILAFGAVAESCMDRAADRLPALVPFLVDRMSDPQSKVRSIACWTLSKYAPWVTREAAHNGAYADYFGPTLDLVVRLARDGRKSVQHAACLALLTYLETCDAALVRPFAQALVEHFAACLCTYQRRNMLLLYDCITTFVDKVPEYDYAPTLLPPLLHNWQSVDDDDSALWPLLECMSAVAAAMGDAFAPYAVPVYNRALTILSSVLQDAVATHPDIEVPEMDFAVTTLDLVDGLVQGFKGHFVELAAQNSTPLLPLVAAALDSDTDDVRQLAFALLGDLVIHVYDPVVAPHVDAVVVCIGHEIANANYLSYAVTNNAIWVCGEIALVAEPNLLSRYIPNLVDLLVPLLTLPETHQSVLENAAICLGRFGLAGGAPVVAPRLLEFIYSWCSHMMCFPEDEEKESAFLGMVKHIEANPDHGFGGLANQQGRKNLAVFVGCIGTYHEPSPKLRDAFFLLLSGYKSLLGDAWDSQVLSLVDTDSRGFLKTTYGI